MQLPRSLCITLDKQTKKLLQQHAKSRDQYKDVMERILQKKQSQINQEIQKLNRQHLLVLQKKVLIIQKKDDQIVKLNNVITDLKKTLKETNDLNINIMDESTELQIKNNYYKKNIGELQMQMKDLKAKKVEFKKQLDIKKQQLSILNQKYEKLQREYIKYKKDISIIQQRSNSILKNQQIIIKQQFQAKLESVRVQEKTKILTIQTKLKHQKKKYQQLQTLLKNQKQNNQNLIIMIQDLKKSIKPVPLVLTKNVQTDSPPQKVFKDYLVEVNMECSDCITYRNNLKYQRQLHKNKIELLQDKNKNKSKDKIIIQKNKQFSNMQVQTQKQIQVIIQKQDNSTQTKLKLIPLHEVNQFIENYQEIEKILKRKLQIQKEKYKELQIIFINRPMRNQDKLIFNQLELQKLELKLSKLKYQQENKILIQSIQNLNQQIKQIKSLSQNSMVIQSKRVQQNNIQKFKQNYQRNHTNSIQFKKINKLSQTFSFFEKEYKNRSLTQCNQFKDKLLSQDMKNTSSNQKNQKIEKIAYRKYSLSKRKPSQDNKRKFILVDY